MGCGHSQMMKEISKENLFVQSDHTPWKLLHTSNLQDWVSSDHNRFGFPIMDYSVQKIRLQPWCMAGRHFEVLLPAPAEYQELNVAYCYDEMLVVSESLWESHRIHLRHSYRNRLLPAKGKSKPCLFKDNAQVIGVHDNLAVIQVVRCDNRCDFLIIDLKRNRVRGNYVENYSDKPCLYECYISPDHTTFLLKPSLLYSLRYRVQQVDDVVKVLMPAKQVKGYHVAAELFPNCAMEIIFAFDPRYGHSQAAVANLTTRSSHRGQHALCIYSLKSKKILNKSLGPQYQRVQNMSFSPGGDFLATLVVTYSLGQRMHPDKYNLIATMVYDTEGLRLLRRIQAFNCAVSTLVPSALFPLFSQLGHTLAVCSGTGNSINQVDVYDLPTVFNLQSLCRQRIRRVLSSEEINQVQVPQKMRDYLSYRPLED